MLVHGVPWQFAICQAFMISIAIALLLILSIVSGYFAWPPLITVILLGVSFLFLMTLIPTFLNLSRSFFVGLIIILALLILADIISFALHYWNSGILNSNGEVDKTFMSAIYFSITTFTTLGYGDFHPLSEMRLVTSMQALSGMLTMAIGASMVWLWCQENLIPKEMAYFDGNRRHKTSLSIGRRRIRTISGKEKVLKNYVLPPNMGERYYWHSNREEWIKIDETNQPKKGDMVVEENSAEGIEGN